MRTKSRVIDHGVQKGIKDFQTLKNTAVRNTLDTCAGLTRRNAVAEVKRDFHLRNNWTVKNIRFEKVPTNNIGMMQARVGATDKAPYMLRQEEGGTRENDTNVTAIGQKGSRRGESNDQAVTPGKRITKWAKNRMIRGSGTRNFSSRKAFAVARMVMAYRKKFFVRRGMNIFFVNSFSKVRNKKTSRVKFVMKHVYTIKTTPIKVNRETWLEPSFQKPKKDLPRIYKSNLKKLWKYADIK